jgi:hypothetical protein
VSARDVLSARPLSNWPTRPGMNSLPCATDRAFPRWLRAARLEAGLSLRELAMRTQLSTSYLSALERDTPNNGAPRQPSAAALGRLRRALGAGA